MMVIICKSKSNCNKVNVVSTNSKDNDDQWRQGQWQGEHRQQQHLIHHAMHNFMRDSESALKVLLEIFMVILLILWGFLLFLSVFWFCIGHHLRRFVLHPGGQLLYIIVFAERGHLLRIVRWGVWGQGFDGADCLGVLWKANDLDSKGGNYDSNMIQTNSYTASDTVSMFYILYILMFWL